MVDNMDNGSNDNIKTALKHAEFESNVNEKLERLAKIDKETIINNVYKNAWETFWKRIESKTTWGKNELKQLMLECLVDQKKEA